MRSADDNQGFLLQVWWPKVYCVLGEIQFSLLMGIIYGNFAEEPLCKPSQPPKVPIGATLPNPPAQPDILGVEMGQPTFWSLEVLFHKAWFLLESEYSPLSDIGAGKEVAQVGFALASLRVEQYECTSIRTQVMSEAFSVRDVRHRQVCNQCGLYPRACCFLLVQLVYALA